MDENGNGGNYQPSPRVEEILNYAMERIQSVPYHPSGRWVFYQIHQKFGMKKGDSKKFDKWTSRTRKSFWNGWRPDIFSDSVRNALVRGHGSTDPSDALDGMREETFVFDKFLHQENYVEVWYEAAAMHEQFKNFTREWYTTLVPFRGDASIPYKYEIAERLDEAAERYGLPIVILYFGDYDEKGLSIPISACNDIRKWCETDFEFIRCGINADQVGGLDIPENPEKPGTYQWEALGDEQAREMVINNLSKYVDIESMNRIFDKETELEAIWKEKMDSIITEMIEEYER